MKLIATKSEQEWLEKRRAGVTATEVARLHQTRTAASWERLRDEKRGAREGFRGNQYTRWGHEREPEIADYAAAFVDSRLVLNSDPPVIAVHPSEPRFIATPDMLSADGEIIAELKTTMAPLPEKTATYRLYQYQIQWQLLVTGAEACVLVWEQHDDGTVLDTQSEIIRPDLEVQEALQVTAREFLAFMGGEPPAWLGEPDSLEQADEIADLAAELAAAKEATRRAKEREAQVQARLVEVSGGSLSGEYGGFKVNVSKTRDSQVFDATAFKKEHADLHKQYMTKTRKGYVRVSVTAIEKEAA